MKFSLLKKLFFTKIKKLKKTIKEENRTEKLNSNYYMKLRIYTKDNNRGFIISLEGVNTAKKFIQYGLKLTKI